MSIYSNSSYTPRRYDGQARSSRSYRSYAQQAAVPTSSTSPQWAMFVAAQPGRAAWIATKAPTFEFAASMMTAVIRYGDLTENQGAAVDRCIERDAQRNAPRAAEPAYNNGLDMAAVREVLAERVRARQRAKIVIEGFEISLAPATGRNPGAIYVKDNGTYVGKIAASTESFVPARDFDAARMPVLQAVFRDPQGAVRAQAARIAVEIAAAAAEGRVLSMPCGCCGLTLTDPVSIARGIGPICAGRWGF